MAWRISRDKQFNSAKKNNQIMHSLTFKIVESQELSKISEVSDECI